MHRKLDGLSREREVKEHLSALNKISTVSWTFSLRCIAIDTINGKAIPVSGHEGP
jgi:hypothetical protein